MEWYSIGKGAGRDQIEAMRSRPLGEWFDNLEGSIGRVVEVEHGR